ARPPGRTFFPYTTLFRSGGGLRRMSRVAKLAGGRRSRFLPTPSLGSSDGNCCGPLLGMRFALAREWPSLPLRIIRVPTPPLVPRSEEHTSELQSRENLVC